MNLTAQQRVDLANTLAVGDVVQIDPAHDPAFAACFLVVTELKSWGVMGYVRVPGENGGDAYYRVPFEKIHRVGRAEWDHAETPTAEDRDEP